MNKYIVIAFAFLGVWFYEASGGADFEPGENSLVVFADPKELPERAEPRRVLVAQPEPREPLVEIVEVRASVAPADAQPTTAIVAPIVEAAVQEPDPAQIVEATVEAAPEPVLPAPDFRFVDGDRVNMRSGPGTSFDVVTQLLRDDMVEVLSDNGDGWLELRDTVSGQEGWMADWLVTASN